MADRADRYGLTPPAGRVEILASRQARGEELNLENLPNPSEEGFRQGCLMLLTDIQGHSKMGKKVKDR